MNYLFDDFVRTTMGAAKNKANGNRLAPEQMRVVADYLRSPGSGIDKTSSFEDFVNKVMAINPPKLPLGMDYIVYAGASEKKSNYENSSDYVTTHRLHPQACNNSRHANPP